MPLCAVEGKSAGPPGWEGGVFFPWTWADLHLPKDGAAGWVSEVGLGARV